MKIKRGLLGMIFLIITINHSFGQYYQKEKGTKTIVQQRSIYLNGGLRASADGKSRIVIPFDLPKNTIEWYYSFTTSAGESGTANLNLALQMSSYLVDQSGVTAAFLSEVKIPNGSSSIDAYLLNSENQIAFVEKWDNNGGLFYYIAEGSVSNTKQAVVKVDDVLSGRLYLGFKNPSTLDGVNIKVEIIAITETDVYVDEWTSESTEELKVNCLNSFITDSKGKLEVCNCLVGKIKSEYKPSEWNGKVLSHQMEFQLNEKENCYTTTSNIELRDIELNEQIRLKKQEDDLNASTSKIYEILQAADASKEMGDYLEARKNLLTAVEMIVKNETIKETIGNETVAEIYNSIAWYSLLLNDTVLAEENLKKGLIYNSSSMYIRGNLAHYHLLKGNYSEAEKAYLYYKRNDKLPGGQKWVDVIAADLQLLESKGVINDDFNKIRVLLKIK